MRPDLAPDTWGPHTTEAIPSASDATHIIVRVQRGQLTQLIDGVPAAGVRLLPRSDNTYDLGLIDASAHDIA